MFLTGGTGLVGSHLASLLRAQGLRVRALHRGNADTGHLRRVGCELVEGSLEDGEGPLAVGMEGSKAMIHAAALTHTQLPWDRVRKVNVDGTANVFRAAVAAGVERSVHVSSVVVYGDQEGPLDEEVAPTASLSPGETYARSKREAEGVVREISERAGMGLTVLRPSAVYGEGDRVFMPKLVQFLRRRIHPLPGGGRTRFATVYAGNVAHAAFAALQQADQGGYRLYNLAEDHAITLRGLCSEIAQLLRIRFRPVSIPASLILGLARLGDTVGLRVPGAKELPLRRAARLAVLHNPYRSTRIRAELGWEPPVPLEVALRRTASELTASTGPS